MVRAKMKCHEIAQRVIDAYDHEAKKTVPTPQEVVKLTAVYGDENKPWSQHTPQGTVELHITNPEAVKQFAVGGVYYVDFTPAPDA